MKMKIYGNFPIKRGTWRSVAFLVFSAILFAILLTSEGEVIRRFWFANFVLLVACSLLALRDLYEIWSKKSNERK